MCAGAGRVVLTRIDATRNMRRFYMVQIMPTLFGEWQLVREWGRLGSPGQVQSRTYPDEAEAEQARQRSVSQKLRRGYLPVSNSRKCPPQALDWTL